MKTTISGRIAKIAAGFLAVVLLAVVLISSWYIAEEAGHDCTGENCPVCETIRQCETVLRHVGLGVLLAVSVVIPTVLHSLSGSLRAYELPQRTPVSLKVRLND